MAGRARRGGGICAGPSTTDAPWASLQTTRLGPGPPSPPLSGSSCPSTKLRSAAEGGRVVDPRPRQCPGPTGGASLPLARPQPGRGSVACGGGGSVCLSCLGPCLSRPCLPVDQELGFRGVGAWPSALPPVPSSSATWPPPAVPDTVSSSVLQPPEVPRPCSPPESNFAALSLGRSRTWEAPASCPPGLEPFSLSPPVTMMTAGSRRRPCLRPLSPHSPCAPRSRPHR